MDLSDIQGKLLSGRVYPEFFPFESNPVVVNLGAGRGPQLVSYQGQYKEMIGVDINRERVDRSMVIATSLGIDSYRAIEGNVEATGLETAAADVILAIDIAEHVQSPASLMKECRRLLKTGGSLVITYPTMHDKYLHNWIVDVAKCVIKRKGRSHHHHGSQNWDPDAHNSAMGIGEWIELTEAAGFSLNKSRATTMFPPFHAIGIPRFWFSNNLIHAVDYKFAGIPFIKRFGQSMLCHYIAK